VGKKTKNKEKVIGSRKGRIFRRTGRTSCNVIYSNSTESNV